MDLGLHSETKTLTKQLFDFVFCRFVRRSLLYSIRKSINKETVNDCGKCSE